MIDNPQNPYDSFAVQASAGAGKTYQLSRRFLNLVGTGAAPQDILTITFTVKAAGEMKERIIKEAAKLLGDPMRQKQFSEDLSAFHKPFQESQAWPVKNPRTALETAHAVLSATQTLKISTIDALFYEWTAKFPWEASAKLSPKDKLRLPFKLLDSVQSQELNRAAWERLFSLPHLSPQSAHQCKTLLAHNRNQGILGWEHTIFELFRYYTFLWQTEHAYGRVLSSFECGPPITETHVFDLITNELYAIINEMTKKETFLQALTRRNLSILFQERFFNQDGEVSGNLIRGRKRDKLLPQIIKVNEIVGLFLTQRQLEALNQTGHALHQLYKSWLSEREYLKKKMGAVEFHDLALGSYRLFHEPQGTGASWMIQSSFRHLLIDEFQDTSFLQWSIFRRLIEEILSGSSLENTGLPATVFLVGDKKQSIYGFREAEPIVLDHTSELLSKFEKRSIPLHESYRSAPVILNFVNKLFTQWFDPEFPLHKTARDEEGNPVIPDCGHVLVLEECITNEKEKRSAIEEEAHLVATTLRKAIRGETPTKGTPHPVFVKDSKQFRPLRASDCAVLYRSSLDVEVFENALRMNEIPYYREEKKGFFSRPEILDSLAFLRCLFTPSDLCSLVTVLKSPILNIEDSQILHALDATQKAEQRELAILDLLEQRSPEKISQLKKFMLQAFGEPPHKILEDFWDRFSVQQSYGSSPGLNGSIACNNLRKFRELLVKLSNEGLVTLALLLPELEELATKNEEGSNVGNIDAVKLMTIHKSKGLEFPLVALVEASDPWYRVDRYWSKVQGEQPAIAYIGTSEKRPRKHAELNSTLDSTKQSLKKEAERLLYVAMTRASQYLLISAHENRACSESFYPKLRQTFLEP